jgi:hypothetical protein
MQRRRSTTKPGRSAVRGDRSEIDSEGSGLGTLRSTGKGKPVVSANAVLHHAARVAEILGCRDPSANPKDASVENFDADADSVSRAPEHDIILPVSSSGIADETLTRSR